MGCAGVANGLSTALLNPSDVVKLRLQSPGGAALYRGVGDCARKISAEQGIASLWTTALAATLLREALYSTTYTPHGAIPLHQILYVCELAGIAVRDAFCAISGAPLWPLSSVRVRMNHAHARHTACDSRFSGALFASCALWHPPPSTRTVQAPRRCGRNPSSACS
mgnify:FL=1